MFAQGGTRLGVQCLDLFGNIATRDNAKLFAHPKGKALGQAGQGFIAHQRQQRLECGGDFAVDEMLQPALHFCNHLWTSLFIDKGHDQRLQRFRASGQLAYGMFAPHQPTLFGEINLGIRRIIKSVGAQMKLRRQSLRRGLRQRFGLVRRTGFVHPEPEPFQPPDKFALDRYITLVTYFGHKDLLLLEPPGQNTGPPIHETLGQCLVQGI